MTTSASPSTPEEIRIVAPTGCLGYGFDREDFTRTVAEHSPHVIAVDAGSTDPGPYYLGAGESFTNRSEVYAELDLIIGEALRTNAVVIVGSSGGAGANSHLGWTRDIVLELAAARGWSFRLATITAEVEAEYVLSKSQAGDVYDFESESPLTSDAIHASATIVAQMGVEPIIDALERGARVVLAGRACDDAIFAAFPIMHGFHPGLALHLGKILECGALAAEPIGMDVMVGILRGDHFDLVPGSKTRACTELSVVGHSLYEREHLFTQEGPAGTVDLSTSVITQMDSRTVRVSGTGFSPGLSPTVKLEGVRLRGFRTICIAGMRCPAALKDVSHLLDEAKRRTRSYFNDFIATDAKYDVAFHVYGRDGVMKELEPYHDVAHEVGLVIDVVAENQNLAHTVCHHIGGALLHLDFPDQYNNAGNLAFPFSPAEIDAGPVYEFSVYHLLRLSDPLEPFEILVEEISPTSITSTSVRDVA